MSPDDDVGSLKGVGSKTQERLKHMGIVTVGDLLEHYPRDYRRYPVPCKPDDTSYDDICPAAYTVSIPDTPRVISKGHMTITILDIRTSSGSLAVHWYNMPYIRRQLIPGEVKILYGRIRHSGSRRVLEQPDIFSMDQYAGVEDRIEPVYGITSGLSQKFFVKTMRMVTDADMTMTDRLPERIREKYGLCEYNAAIRQIHFPDNEDSCRLARKRLVFDEFFRFALNMKMISKDNLKIPNSFRIDHFEAADGFIKRLPYKLTGAQMRVWSEIQNDLAGEHPMNRLIQGDVGSGKTVLAALALLAAVFAGYQGCMMAPTEVLAKQHYDTLSGMFDGTGIRIVLLTGSLGAPERREVYAETADGRADIIIGTQALFQEKLKYHHLALIVTDEQHRFGVHQRERLTRKSGESVPHVLVMSATPIPRTLAMILYGDLDISVLDEKPADRLPVKNSVVGESYRPAAWRFIEKQVRMGHQAYVICPMVEESENVDAENVLEYAENLRGALPGDVRVGCLHGKMKPKDKDEIMEKFETGQTDVLVSTTVVEVGVDVPNATVMLIENAERFGLAQLHQLRGRVGRGQDQSYCIFIYGQDNEKIRKRLEVLQHTNDGFRIAEEDLKQRGPGDMFGVRQSGDITFKIGDVFADAEILIEAGEAAEEALNDDPGIFAADPGQAVL